MGPVKFKYFVLYFPLLSLFTSSVACNDNDIQAFKLNVLQIAFPIYCMVHVLNFTCDLAFNSIFMDFYPLLAF